MNLFECNFFIYIQTYAFHLKNDFEFVKIINMTKIQIKHIYNRKDQFLVQTFVSNITYIFIYNVSTQRLYIPKGAPKGPPYKIFFICIFILKEKVYKNVEFSKLFTLLTPLHHYNTGTTTAGFQPDHSVFTLTVDLTYFMTQKLK